MMGCMDFSQCLVFTLMPLALEGELIFGLVVIGLRAPGSLLWLMIKLEKVKVVLITFSASQHKAHLKHIENTTYSTHKQH